MINDNQFQISLNEKLLISIQSYQKKASVNESCYPKHY